jgi:hypothetical protein
MTNKTAFTLYGVVILLTLLAVNGCQPSGGREGIHVMFDGVPKISHTEVYYRGRVIGKIHDQQGSSGPVTKVTVEIDPRSMQYAGRHWAFYVDSGRLTAEALNVTGQTLGPGDRVSGFRSKKDLTWFKIKTMLSHRGAKAKRRAEKLYLRYTQSG